MNTSNFSSKLKRLFSKTGPLTDVERREAFLTGVCSTTIFSRMPCQDKITSLAKLIGVFYRDYGYIPQPLEKLLVEHNIDFHSQLYAKFVAKYSDGIHIPSEM